MMNFVTGALLLWLMAVASYTIIYGLYVLAGKVAARLAGHRPGVQLHELEPSPADLATAEKRREDARANCELLYALHRHEVGERFTKEMFDDWTTKYMRDNREPEYVEKRGHQLQGIIRDLVKQIRPAEQPQTIAELKAWRTQLRMQIIEGEDNSEAREDQLLELDKRYEELQKRIIRGDLV